MRSRRGSTIPRCPWFFVSRGCSTLRSRRFSMTGKAMGEGERAEARRLARMRNMILGSLVCAVLIIGAAFMFKQSGGRIAPAGAITIVVLYLTAMIGFGRWVCGGADEV